MLVDGEEQGQVQGMVVVENGGVDHVLGKVAQQGDSSLVHQAEVTEHRVLGQEGPLGRQLPLGCTHTQTQTHIMYLVYMNTWWTQL